MSTNDGRAARRIRLGMVGGGDGSFIGAAHRIAARLDDQFELVAGALSSTAERAHASAARLHIAPERSYADYTAMAQAEARREDGIDAVAIVTPNDTHYRYAAAALDAGLDVVGDKPVSQTYAEALDLVERMRRARRIFAVAHAYSAYPMTRHARQLVRDGALGPVRLVQVEYIQSGLATRAVRSPDTKLARCCA